LQPASRSPIFFEESPSARALHPIRPSATAAALLRSSGGVLFNLASGDLGDNDAVADGLARAPGWRSYWRKSKKDASIRNTSMDVLCSP